MEIKKRLDQNENNVFDVIIISEEGEFLSQYAVIKVSHCIRDVILKTGPRFIDMESHFVNDHFHIVQCFKCQGIGHKSGSKYCPLYDKASSICQYCSGNHKSISCKWKTDENKRQCANCKNSSSSSIFYLTTRKTPNKNKKQKQWPKNRLQRQNDIR